MTDEAIAETKPAKVAGVINTVKMDDGRIVEFVGKRKMLKESTVEKGQVVVRLDFSNGEVRSYRVVHELRDRFTAHGAEQKLGDEIAGVDDVEDCIEAIDALLIRLEKGEWSVTRQSTSSGIAGSSILVRALVELTGKPVGDIRAAMAQKTQEEKMALRRNSKLRPIIERLEAVKSAKKEKKSGVNSDELLGELMDAPADGAEANAEANAE